MHLEATAVDRVGKGLAGSHIGAKFGHFVGEQLYVRYCSAMSLDLCPEALFPQKHKILSVFWRAMFYPFWGRMRKDGSNILGPDWGQVWPSWALLRYLEVTAMLLGAKLGHLEGKLGYREVVFKLSWAILFGHVVAFSARNTLPPSRTKILSGFLRAMLAPFGVKVRPSYGHVGAILGPISAILGLC